MRRNLAWAIVVAGLLFNLYLDYHMMLRNPAELEARARWRRT